MLPRKFAFLFLTLIVLLAMTLYFPRTTTAQSVKPRLIPLDVLDPSIPPVELDPLSQSIPQTFPARDFVIYGRAGATITDGTEDETKDPPERPSALSI